MIHEPHLNIILKDQSIDSVIHRFCRFRKHTSPVASKAWTILMQAKPAYLLIGLIDMYPIRYSPHKHTLTHTHTLHAHIHTCDQLSGSTNYRDKQSSRILHLRQTPGARVYIHVYIISAITILGYMCVRDSVCSAKLAYLQLKTDQFNVNVPIMCLVLHAS